MSANQSALQRHLADERARSIAVIENELNSLSDRISRALKNLASGYRVDDHLIANAAMLTHEITRWNMLLELQSYADDPDHGGVPCHGTKETNR